MSSIKRLEARQRFEEAVEQFGGVIEVRGEQASLPFRCLEHVRLDGRRVSPVVLATRAEGAGLEADEVGIVLPLDGDVAQLEDRLTVFLESLLEADPQAFLLMPKPGLSIPVEGTLPQSRAWLERFYGDGFLPREKKPLVVDLRRSQGPYLRSVDEEPLQIIDAASQIATLAAGVRPGRVQASLDDGHMAAHLVAATPVDEGEGAAVAQRFARRLLAMAPPGMKYVAFANGGAEANEKAFHIARRNGPGGRRILAFEGAFHGRTLLSLYSTWNPVKRIPYQLPGFETTFIPTPSVEAGNDPPIPVDWRKAWSLKDGRRSWGGSAPLLLAEVESLSHLEREILAGDICCCIIEPFQSEGGDKAPSRRFFHGLRALTRAYGIPLIFDEVQVGYGLGGPLFWYELFHLMDAEGHPDGPDLLTGAKRAQVGYVVSRWPDDVPTPAHVASMIRGMAHLDLILAHGPRTDTVRDALASLVLRWPDVVTHPRVEGDAFAFDLPSREIANHLIGQRFYRGYMLYIAGQRSLRYRLNRSMTAEDIRLIFSIIDRSLTALVDQAGGAGPNLIERMSACEPAPWMPPPEVRAAPSIELDDLLDDSTGAAADQILRECGELSVFDRLKGRTRLRVGEIANRETLVVAARTADAADFEAGTGVSLLRFMADALGTRVRRVGPAEWASMQGAIDDLIATDDAHAHIPRPADLHLLTGCADGVFLIAEDIDGLVGIHVATPLEQWPSLDGPRQDPHRGRRDTLYGVSLRVAERARGRGIGIRLKAALITAALQARRGDGRPRYAFVTGRNAVRGGEEIWALNQRFGAYEVRRCDAAIDGTVPESRYYRVPIRRHDRRDFARRRPEATTVELHRGLEMPTGRAHPLLERARQRGVFDQAACTKLTVSNFITRPYVRYSEYLQEVAPEGCPHLYFTSSNDEMVDKSLRALKHMRGEGVLAVGVQGGYLGHTTAAARSLSGPGGTDPRFGYFDWPLIPHPADGVDATLTALDDLVARHGAQHLLGVYLEAIQRRTGRVLGAEAWTALCAWRDRTGVPLVLSENVSGFYRAGRGRFWWVDGVAGHADLVLWWSGGQIGHVFSSDAAFVAKPLTLISTWDGDQLSATRLLHQMYAVDGDVVAARGIQLARGLREIGLNREERGGTGLYRVLRLGEYRASLARDMLADAGFRVDQPGRDVLAVAPALTVKATDLDRFLAALAHVVDQV